MSTAPVAPARDAEDERRLETTIIWRDGEVLRRAPGGPWKQMPPAPPLPDENHNHEPALVDNKGRR